MEKNYWKIIGKSVLFFIIIGILIYCASADIMNISPADDSYTLESTPTGKRGNKSYLYVDGGVNSDMWTWLKFDLSPVPPGVTILSARLNLYAYSVGDTNLDTGAFHSSDDSWTESGIIWSNQPPTAVNYTDLILNPTEDTWLTWNVTNDVRSDFVSGDYKSTWCLRYDGHDSEKDVRFRSKEYSNSEHHPYLEITYTTGEVTTSTTTSTTTIPSAPEFTSLAIVATVLLTAPIFAYLIVRRRSQ